MTRASRRCISVVLFGLLFAQIAVAAYGCTASPTGAFALTGVQALPDELAGSDHTDRDDAAHAPLADMTCDREQMDRGEVNLCVTHCRHDERRAQYQPAPAVLLPALTAYIKVFPEARAYAVRSQGVPRHSPAASPPHAIVHCCFRI